jgi:hypothetical protein
VSESGHLLNWADRFPSLPILGRGTTRETTTELFLSPDLLNWKEPGTGAGPLLCCSSVLLPMQQLLRTHEPSALLQAGLLALLLFSTSFGVAGDSEQARSKHQIFFGEADTSESFRPVRIIDAVGAPGPRRLRRDGLAAGPQRLEAPKEQPPLIAIFRRQ